MISLQEFLSRLVEELVTIKEFPCELADDGRVAVNAYIYFRRGFIPEHSTPSKVGFYVDAMRWNQVYQLLEATELPARVSHPRTIVRSDEDVNT
jgi:hypothetical protein